MGNRKKSRRARRGNAARTVAQVTASLAKRNTPSKRTVNSPLIDNHYLACRLAPFDTTGVSKGIPDGSNIKRIVSDHLGFVDIALNNGCSGFIVKLWPGLPAGCTITPIVPAGTAGGVVMLTVSGMVNATITAGNSLPGSTNPFTPLTRYPELIMTAVNQVDNPYQASTVRLVTAAAKLVYSGPALSASGQIVCRDNSLQVNSTMTTPAVGVNISTYDANGLGPNLAVLPYVTMDLPSIQNTIGVLPKGYFSTRSEDGASVILKHNTNNYRWMPWMEQINFLGFNGGTLNAFSPPSLIANDFGLSGFAVLDTDWNCPEMVVSGLAASSTFRLYVTHCIEYSPNLTSAFNRLAPDPPPASPITLAVADAVMQKAPPGRTATNTRGLLNSALSVVSKVAPAIGGAFGGVGAAIGGGVSTLATALQQLTM